MDPSTIVNLQSSIPKRRYTVSDQSRAASRLNAAKAREVWQRQRRQPGFRLPHAVLEAIHRGLVKAARWRLTNCSRRYASRFRHGVFAVSLERSLARAGETLDDYLAYVQRIVRAFAGSSTNNGPRSMDAEPTPASSPSIVATLATALAQVSWRRLRAFRIHAEGERLAVFRAFRQLAAEREAAGALTPGRLVRLAGDLHEALWPAWPRLPLHLRRLNRRFEALAGRLLNELGLPPMDLHVRASPAVDCAGTYSLAEALGNPLRNRGKVRAALARREPRVKPPEHWRWRTGPPGGANARSRTPDPAVGGDDAGPATLEDFRTLVERALGPNSTLKPAGPDAEAAGLAEALWERLEFRRRHALEERKRFSALVDDYLASLDSGVPSSAIGNHLSSIVNSLTKLATGLVEVLRSDGEFCADAAVLDGRAQVWIYRMLLARRIPRRDIVLLQPEPPDTSGMLLEALTLEKAGQHAEAERLLGKADEITEEWGRWEKFLKSFRPKPEAT
jgi:hypothetical protein